MVEVIELLKFGAVGLVAGFFASYRTRRDFISQRWWERKVEAYSRIIEALGMLIDYDEKMYDREIEQEQWSKENLKDLQKQWKAGHDEVCKASSIGTFLISEDAFSALKQYFKRPENIRLDDLLSVMEHDLEAAKVCLESVKNAAMRDLKVNRSLGL